MTTIAQTDFELAKTVWFKYYDRAVIRPLVLRFLDVHARDMTMTARIKNADAFLSDPTRTVYIDKSSAFKSLNYKFDAQAAFSSTAQRGGDLALAKILDTLETPVTDGKIKHPAHEPEVTRINQHVTDKAKAKQDNVTGAYNYFWDAIASTLLAGNAQSTNYGGQARFRWLAENIVDGDKIQRAFSDASQTMSVIAYHSADIGEALRIARLSEQDRRAPKFTPVS